MEQAEAILHITTATGGKHVLLAYDNIVSLELCGNTLTINSIKEGLSFIERVSFDNSEDAEPVVVKLRATWQEWLRWKALNATAAVETPTTVIPESTT